MSTISVGILGLNRIGASVALALRRYNNSPNPAQKFNVTIFDNSITNLREARKMNFASESTDRLTDAASNKDILLLAVSYADLPLTYEAIGRAAKAGAVVIDTALLKQPSRTWARQHLPQEVHQVGATPVINPKYLFNGVDTLENAQEDLFDKGSMLLMPGVGCAAEAVELASDFSELLGAKPHFVDPVEHDSLIAAVEGLPALLGVATYAALYQQDGWLDAQRMINTPFGQLTHHLFDTHPDDLRDLWLKNSDNLVRYLDQLMRTLQVLRDGLAREDRDALEDLLGEVSTDYEKWINRRYSGKWQTEPKDGDAPSIGGVASNLFGTFLTKRIKGRGSTEEQD